MGCLLSSYFIIAKNVTHLLTNTSKQKDIYTQPATKCVTKDSSDMLVIRKFSWIESNFPSIQCLQLNGRQLFQMDRKIFDFNFNLRIFNFNFNLAFALS